MGKSGLDREEFRTITPRVPARVKMMIAIKGLLSERIIQITTRMRR